MKISVNRDIRKYQPKDIGPFTLKQGICLIIALVIMYAIYLTLDGIKSMDARIGIAIIPASIPLLFGFVHPYGLTFWQYIRTILKENVLSPKTRVYESDFDFEATYDESKEVPEPLVNPTPKKELKKYRGYP